VQYNKILLYVQEINAEAVTLSNAVLYTIQDRFMENISNSTSFEHLKTTRVSASLTEKSLKELKIMMKKDGISNVHLGKYLSTIISNTYKNRIIKD
jgi:hypothetical protein